jgi:hypothetical protein
MNSRPFTRRFRQAGYLAAAVVLLGAARAIPLDVFKRAISVLASAVWGS